MLFAIQYTAWWSGEPDLFFVEAESADDVRVALCESVRRALVTSPNEVNPPVDVGRYGSPESKQGLRKALFLCDLLDEDLAATLPFVEERRIALSPTDIVLPIVPIEEWVTGRMVTLDKPKRSVVCSVPLG